MKACLCSSYSTLRTKIFKRIIVEEFLFSKITVLELATLPDNELLHRHSPAFLIAIIEWYKGIARHFTIVLKFHRSLEKSGKNILKGEYQNERIKYEGGMISLRYPLQSSYACNFLHAIFSNFLLSKWRLSVKINRLIVWRV